jgi:hypothetical protein
LVSFALRVGKGGKGKRMRSEKRCHAARRCETDSYDLGIELLERFKLLSYLPEVSAARNSGKVA